MGYYVYKYVEDDEIKYIGQTVDLDKRIQQHTKDKLANFNGKIYYFECSNKTAMNSWEYCLINKYHPIYNVALKDADTSINIEEPEWIEYKNIVLDNLLYFPIKKDINIPKIPTKTQAFIRPKRRFRCYKCQISFVTDRWFSTAKGFSADCPSCYRAAWISKATARNQDRCGISL